MALIQCQECKQEISDKAAACPHCGAPRIPGASASPITAAPPAAASPPPAPAVPPPAPPSAAVAAPFVAATPPPAAPAPPPARGGGARLLIALAILLVVGVVVLQVVKRGAAHASGSPAPTWLVDNVDANDSCTVLGEFCIRVRCAVMNSGTAAGVVQVTAELNEDSTRIGTRRATRTLVPGEQDTLTFDFPEANLGKEHSFRCAPVP